MGEVLGHAVELVDTHVPAVGGDARVFQQAPHGVVAETTKAPDLCVAGEIAGDRCEGLPGGTGDEDLATPHRAHGGSVRDVGISHGGQRRVSGSVSGPITAPPW